MGCTDILTIDEDGIRHDKQVRAFCQQQAAERSLIKDAPSSRTQLLTISLQRCRLLFTDLLALYFYFPSRRRGESENVHKSQI